ncbi:MAG: hypothetical protein JNL69_03750 [Bacteroidia bacterium]|nr:hypothetical protein [Bacteroidia bacterium]
MRDVFYTILVIWIIWQIIRNVSAYNNRNKPSSQGNTAKPNPSDRISSAKSKMAEQEGEYVDYEEIK